MEHRSHYIILVSGQFLTQLTVWRRCAFYDVSSI